MKTKKIKILFGLFTTIMMFASIGLACAYKPQPHAMVWIVPSDSGNPNAFTLTYQNFGYRSIGGISVEIVSQAVSSSETGSPALATITATYAGWAVQSSSSQISWESTRAPDRAHLDFYVYNTPCAVRYTLFDKNGNTLQTNLINLT